MNTEQEDVLKRNEAQRDEGAKIMAEITEGNFTGYAYADDAEVVISGKLMTSILSLLQNHQLHTSNMQNAYNNLGKAQDAMLLEDTDVLLAYMRLHIENCRNGIAIPEKDKNTIEAKEKIQPI